MTQRHEIEAWLGDAAADLTSEQIEELRREAEAIYKRHPHPDEASDREAALTAAAKAMFGDE